MWAFSIDFSAIKIRGLVALTSVFYVGPREYLDIAPRSLPHWKHVHLVFALKRGSLILSHSIIHVMLDFQHNDILPIAHAIQTQC
jgi:hypothetical protein